MLARAEELFADWLVTRRHGEAADVESLCDAYPELATRLRALWSHWEGLRAVLDRVGANPAAGSVAERIEERYGDGVDPHVLLEGEQRSDPPSSALLRRLAEHAFKSSRYRLQGELARGGMGAILKIWDEDLRRTLAMKVILGRGDPETGKTPPVDQRSLTRFLEEAQVTGQLDHPGVVPVHELGLDADGRVYFTMKLVKGRDLRAIFELAFREQEGWNETRALGVVLKVCEALSYAHSKGVIHRDLKPANVMVGKYGEVFVMDWGLARVLGRADTRDIRLRRAPDDSAPTEVETERRAQGEDAPDSPLVTMDGDVVGTPSYMPPEQARGEIEKLSPRSDVYAVGALLYHLLARRVPYVPPGRRMSNYGVLAMLLRGPPPRLHTLRGDLPAELVAICEKAMAREPQLRYGDTLELAEDLRAYLEHRVVKAYQTGALAELRKWIERNHALAASAAAALLLLLAGLTTSLAFKVRADSHAALARVNAERATQQADIARANEERATRSEQRALAGEALAKEEKERADREAEAARRGRDEVLQLSALQELDDLEGEADRLWPALPENIEKYEDWLREAGVLVAELPDHEQRLADLRSRALPWTEAEQLQQRAEHPRLSELTRAKRQLEHWRMLCAALEPGAPVRDPTPGEVGVDLASLPASANGVNDLAWPLVDPDREDWGAEARGLVLARRALELAAGLAPEQRAGIRDSFAWALLANGRFEEALVESAQALEEAAADRKQEFAGYLERLRGVIAQRTDPGKAAERERHEMELEQRVAALEAEISKRSKWLFASAQDQWWHNQLEKLFDGLRSLSDPSTGLCSAGISPRHGPGIRWRLDLARSLRAGFAGGVHATAWAEALPAIDAAYPGLELTPQIGLVPLGVDPDSGLWEFAHLATGEPAVRGSDGKLVLNEDTGLVLVLLPGGTFSMGAQKGDAARPNHDPGARPDESPVRQVTLSPFFLSKYEMTQGQWLRFTGRNPSSYQPGALVKSLLHPVEQVSWNTCRDVCRRLDLALPSEAQWEYAVRAGTASVWWTGDERESLRGAVNIADRSGARAGGDWPDVAEWPDLDDGHGVHAPVNALQANPFGLHHMLGNVWEWCQDGYDLYQQPVPRDVVWEPKGSPDRVARGGSFALGVAFLRSAYRSHDPPDVSGSTLGLRPARRITP